MADEISVAVVAIKADLTQLRAEMKKISPEAAAATKDMTVAVSRQLKELEKAHANAAKTAQTAHEAANAAIARAAANAAKAAIKSYDSVGASAKKSAATAGGSWNEVAKSLQSNQMISDFEQIGSMFTLVGGSISKVSMIAVSAARPIAMLATMFGPSSLLLAGAAAAPLILLGVSSALRSLADGAVEAEDRLKELGLVTDQTASPALREYRAATADVGVATDELTVSIGDDLAPMFSTLDRALAGTIRYFTDLREASTQTRQEVETFARYGLAAVTLGTTELLRWTVEQVAATDRGGDSYEILAQKALKASQAAALLASTTAESSAALDEIQQVLDERAVAESEAAAAMERTRLAEQASSAAAAERARLIAQVTREIEAQDQVERDRERALAARLEAERQHYLDHYSTIQQASREAAQAAEKDAQTQVKAMQGAASALAGTAQTLLASFEQLAAGNVDYYVQLAAEREAAGQELSAEEQRAATRAWSVQKALAQAQVAIQGTQMGVSFVTALAPLLGPAAIPAGVAAAAAFIGVQSSLIEQQQPPEFPTGLSSDHYMAGLQRGELVASRRAAADPEVREAIDAGNEGRRVGRRPEAVHVEVRVDRRTGRLRVRQARPGKRDRRR